MYTDYSDDDSLFAGISQAFMPGRFALDHVNSTIVQGGVERDPQSASGGLDGFDMVWAVTRDSLNAQLEWLQTDNILPSEVRAGKLHADGLQIGGDGDDRATLAPPLLDFDTRVPNTVRLTLFFTGGTVSFYSGFGPSAPVVKQSLLGWKLAFTVRLRLAELDDARLADPAALPAAIRARLAAVDAAQFSIGEICLDFAASDLINYEARASNLPTASNFLKLNFATALGHWLKLHGGPANPFVLGYPITRKWPSDASTAAFQPTAANLSTRAPAHGEGLPAGMGTLNFLLLTGQRKMTDSPALYSPGAGSFPHALVARAGVDATGLIARRVFLQRYLKPLLVEPLQAALHSLPDYLHARTDRARAMQGRDIVNTKTGVAADLRNGLRAVFVPTPSGWIYSDHVKLAWHETGSNSHDRVSEQLLQYTIDLSSAPDADGRARLTIDVKGALMRLERDQVNQDFPFKHDVYMGKGWARVAQDWAIRLQLVPGADGRLTLMRQAVQQAPLEESGSGGVYHLATLFAELFNLQTIVDDWAGNAASMAALERSVIDGLVAASGPVFDAVMMPVVMPACDSYACEDIQLNREGDVEISLRCVSARLRH
jgi:hypothetical protein